MLNPVMDICTLLDYASGLSSNHAVHVITVTEQVPAPGHVFWETSRDHHLSLIILMNRK